MTVVVCMQPTFLPWIGLFDLIEQSDYFVFLDDLQFSNRSWQQRNRVRTNKSLEWLTVPVRLKGRSGQLINDVEINQGIFFPRKILRSLEQNYGKAKFFKEYYPSIAEIISRSTMLCEMNIEITRYITEKLGIPNKLILSSELNVSGSRSDRLINICKKIGGEVYLSTKGSRDYLVQDAEIFKKNKIEVFIHNYVHPIYGQLHSPFLPYASVVDLMFNEGDSSAEIIRSGRHPSLPIESSYT